MKPAALWIVPLLAFLIFRPAVAQTSTLPPLISDKSSVRLLRTLPLPGNGTDTFALDPVGRRLYLSGDDSLHVLFLDTFAPDDHTVFPNDVRRLKLMPELGRAIVGGRSDLGETLTFLNLTSLTPTGPPIPLGEGDFHVCFDRAMQRVFAFNADYWVSQGKDAICVDGTTGKIVGTVSLGATPRAYVSDGNGEMFAAVSYEHSSEREMVVFDARTLAVKRRWTLSPYTNVRSLAVDWQHRRLFAVTLDSKLLVMNADTGQTITTFPLADGFGTCFFDSLAQRVVIAGNNGTLTWVHEDTPDIMSVQGMVQIHNLVVASAFDPVSQHLFLITAQKAPPPLHPRRRSRIIVYQPGTYALQVYGGGK